MRFVDRVNLALLAVLLAASAWAYPRLPPRIPAHFGAGGEVARWTDASLLSWFLLPLIAGAVVILNHALARALPRRPQLFNFPGKPRLLALPPERRAPVVARIQELLHGTSTLLILLLGYLQWVTYRSAHGADPESHVLAVLLTSLLSVPLVLGLWLPRIQRELDRQARAHREETEAG